MLNFFTSAKAFRGHSAIIRWNTVKSCARLELDVWRNSVTPQDKGQKEFAGG